MAAATNMSQLETATLVLDRCGSAYNDVVLAGPSVAEPSGAAEVRERSMWADRSGVGRLPLAGKSRPGPRPSPSPTSTPEPSVAAVSTAPLPIPTSTSGDCAAQATCLYDATPGVVRSLPRSPGAFFSTVFDPEISAVRDLLERGGERKLLDRLNQLVAAVELMCSDAAFFNAAHPHVEAVAAAARALAEYIKATGAKLGFSALFAAFRIVDLCKRRSGLQEELYDRGDTARALRAIGKRLCAFRFESGRERAPSLPDVAALALAAAPVRLLAPAVLPPSESRREGGVGGQPKSSVAALSVGGGGGGVAGRVAKRGASRAKDCFGSLVRSVSFCRSRPSAPGGGDGDVREKSTVIFSEELFSDELLRAVLAGFEAASSQLEAAVAKKAKKRGDVWRRRTLTVAEPERVDDVLRTASATGAAVGAFSRVFDLTGTEVGTAFQFLRNPHDLEHGTLQDPAALVLLKEEGGAATPARKSS